MKRTFLKKAISLLLVLTMLIPLASTAFAAEAMEEGGVIPYQSDAGLLGPGGDSDSQLFGGGFGGWTLKSIAGGTVSGLVGLGLNAAYKEIFGSDTDKLLAALAEISKKLDDIDNRIGDLQEQLSKKDLNDYLNAYRKDIAQYKSLYKDLLFIKDELGEDTVNGTKFLIGIYDGTERNFNLDGNTLIGLTRKLKTTLVDTKQEVDGKMCNVFSAFDSLDKYVNKWEHQGYADRKLFRSEAIAIFANIALYAKLACIKKEQDCKIKGDTYGEGQAKRTREIIDIDIKEVETMSERYAVIERPNVRYYQVPGHEILLSSKVTRRGLNQSMPEMIKGDPRENFDNGHFKGMGFEWRNFTFQLPPFTKKITIPMLKNINISDTQLMQMYKDYGGKKSLYSIFFDKKEGNFTNADDLPYGKPFATSTFWYTTSRKDNSGPYKAAYMHSVSSEDAALNNNVRLAYVDEDYYGKWTYKFYNEEFFGVTVLEEDNKLQGPAMPDGLISGMEDSYELPRTDPVTLSVEPTDGADYQWFVHEGGDGEDFKEIAGATSEAYTLPTLEASMNGNMYRCCITIHTEGTAEGEQDHTLTDPVMLNLTGEGVVPISTVHEAGNAEELKAAFEKIADGSWDGHTIKLTASIVYPYPVTLIDRSATIDLQGWTMTVQPDSNSEPNINPLSNGAEIAAIYISDGKLETKGGTCSVIAEPGIDYGAYVYGGDSGIDVNEITLTGGTATVYATNDGKIRAGSISAAGENVQAIINFGGEVVVKGNVTATGKSSCGVYANASDDISANIEIGGNLTVSGDNSRGALLHAKGTYMEVAGNVTAAGANSSGVTASGGSYSDMYNAWIYGDVTAPDVAVNASSGAGIRVSGNVESSDEGTSAIYAIGGSVAIEGNVTASGINGTAISASKWDLIDPAAGAFVMVDGTITAYTPLRMESLPVGENEHTGETAVFGHYVYTDGTNTVWANEGSFVSTNPNAKAPGITTHPQDETAEPGDAVTLTVSAKVSDGGILSYQWYSSTTDDLSGSMPIDGATNTSYTPPTDTLGTRYYYAIITNTNEAVPGEKTTQVISRLAAVMITYTVTFDKNGGDTEASPTAKEVTASGNIGALPTAPTRSGYNFNGWNTQADGSGTAFTADTAVTGSMTVYAKWSKKSTGSGGVAATYTVVFDTNGGSGVGAQRLPKNSKVTKPSDPTKDGFTFEGWFTDSKLTKEYDFNTVVTTGFTLYAAWKQADAPNPDPPAQWKNPFADVAKSDWFYTAVEYVHANELFSGTSENAFSPDLPMTRGMLVTVLHRFAGSPAASQSPGFLDVSGGAYYDQSVSWAAENGIVKGQGGNIFAPDGEVTREQLAAILYRYTKWSEKTLPPVREIKPFDDTSSISDFAVDAVEALYSAGMINGKNGNLFDPKGPATRAEVAAILQRFSGIIE